jgi:energy-coupling factor transporter ATP-binding protein EcfA2
MTKIASAVNIRLRSIDFGKFAFRKLKKVKFEFAPRITLIAGHNGIGKSTILGLVASGSGLTPKQYQSYFDRTFNTKLDEIIFIDYANEFKQTKEDEKLPQPLLSYEIGTETLTKRCALTDRSDYLKARIVPRNHAPSKPFVSADNSLTVGVASKVPLPTIYLGMTRVLPVGEAVAGSVTSNEVSSMHPDDRKLIAEFLGAVIQGSKADASKVTATKVKGTSKFSTQPQYAYDARCVSLGQDSLGSIANALASFQKLKREWESYPGGLLIVDELDSGFHPHAIGRLVDELRRLSDILQLQVVATTHSTKLIEAVFPAKSTSRDAVVYIMDTVRPHLLSPVSLASINDDMDLTPPSKAPSPPVLKIYLEDEEAAYVFNTLVTGPKKRDFRKRYGVSFKIIALGVGCDSLRGFNKKDNYFKNCLFVLDADASKKKKVKHDPNIIFLPSKTSKSPEQELFAYLQEAVNDVDKFEARLERLTELGATGNHIQASLLNWDGDVSDRSHAKKWWRDRKKHIHDWKIYEVWADEYAVDVDAFLAELDASVKLVSKGLRKLSKFPQSG